MFGEFYQKRVTVLFGALDWPKWRKTDVKRVFLDRQRRLKTSRLADIVVSGVYSGDCPSPPTIGWFWMDRGRRICTVVIAVTKVYTRELLTTTLGMIRWSKEDGGQTVFVTQFTSVLCTAFGKSRLAYEIYRIILYLQASPLPVRWNAS